jgi:UDP:flavonoid glycosyltransferase YjiC (YdhE family)
MSRIQIYEGLSMKFIIASNPFAGHLNPLLQVASILRSRGHEIVVHTASFLKKSAVNLGFDFVPLQGNADFDSRDMDAIFPERVHLTPGTEQLRFIMEHVFIDAMADQYAGLRKIMSETKIDGIIVDRMFMGTMPFLVDKASPRPAIIHYGFTCLYMEREDGTPLGPGLLPPTSEEQRAQYREIRTVLDKAVAEPVGQYMDEQLSKLGVGPLGMNIFDSAQVMPDLHLQPTVPSFEYPLASVPPSLVFIGALPPPAFMNSQRPAWADDVDKAQRVVLVTQGTFANFDLGELIAPTLEALANEPDTLVIVTTGGRPIDAIPGTIPANARIAEYLSFDWLLPKVDLVVTNGGYGTVNMALRAGVPLVVAGLADDKVEISARIAWSGAGINLGTDHPTSAALREAIMTVLDQPTFKERTARFAAEFAQYDTENEIATRIVDIAERPPALSASR